MKTSKWRKRSARHRRANRKTKEAKRWHVGVDWAPGPSHTISRIVLLARLEAVRKAKLVVQQFDFGRLPSRYSKPVDDPLARRRYR